MNGRTQLPFFNRSAGLLILLCLAISGCNPQGQSNGPAPIRVGVAHPLVTEVTGWKEYNGRIEAMETVDLRARVSGYLKSVKVRDGEWVHQNDLLFVIDPRSYEIEVKRAAAELQRIKTQQELARTALRRADRLRRAKAISDEEYDQRTQALAESTEAQNIAESALMMARLRLEWTEIRAPLSGRIRRELLTPGNLVRENETLLTTIVSVNPAYVYLDVDERTALEIRRHQNQHPGQSTAAELALVDEKDFPHQGYIDYLDPRFERQTGTLSLRGVFQNPDELLNPGLFAKVRLALRPAHEALLIPTRAIATDQDRKFVWLANDDGTIAPRPIIPGALYGHYTEVVSGLESKDEVIIEGLAKLRPGIRIVKDPLTLEFDG